MKGANKMNTLIIITAGLGVALCSICNSVPMEFSIFWTFCFACAIKYGFSK